MRQNGTAWGSTHPSVAVGFAAWAAVALYIAGCLVAPSWTGATACELAPGNSVFGEPTRSWIPPGTTCTYDLSAYGISGPVVLSPSPLRLGLVAITLLGLPALLYVDRVLKHRAQEDEIGS